VLNIKLIYT